MCTTANTLLGQNLKKLRKKANMKQIDVTVALEEYDVIMSRTKYVRIENGTRGISIEELKALTLVFNCDYNALFEGI